MTKILIAFYLTIFFCSCNNQTSVIKPNNKNVSQTKDITSHAGLHGTWVRHNQKGFTLIEIKDTSNILYYEFFDREADLHKPTNDRFWYYKSKAKMGYWDSNNAAIWISTDKFRFDYKVKGDTLIEFDKMGDQGTFMKVYTDEEKAFREFNKTNLKGIITDLTKVEPSEFFVLNNLNRQLSFSSLPNIDKKLFSDLAKVGDSIIKLAYEDTLILYKKRH